MCAANEVLQKPHDRAPYDGRQRRGWENASIPPAVSARWWISLTRRCGRLMLWGYLITVIPACAQWSREKELESGNFLPKPQKSLDSVTVETVLVRFPEQRKQELVDIWQNVDESIFEIEFREKLDRNGLRAGLMIGELPQVVREQIEITSQEQVTNALEHAGLAADVDNKMRQLRCRAGRRKELILRRDLAMPLTVLSASDGAVSGATYYQPTVLFDLRVMPYGDQQTTIELTPEIQHGELRPAFVSTDLGLRSEMQRSQQVWQDLTIRSKLKPGQVLLVAASLPPKALGAAFFTTQTAEQSQEYVILLIRVAESQLDELFAPDEVARARAMIER